CLFLVLFFGGLVVGNNIIEQKRALVAEMKIAETDLKRQLDQESEKAKKLQALHDWEGVPWPDDLYELVAAVPSPIVDSFKVLSVEGMPIKASAKSQPAGAKPAGGGNGGSAADLSARPVARFHLKFGRGTTGGQGFVPPVDEKGNEAKLDQLNTELQKESKSG